MKALTSITKQDVQKLIDCKILEGWEDNRICFPCPYSDDNEHYMVSFNTSEEQASAYDIVFNSIYEEKLEVLGVETELKPIDERCKELTEDIKKNLYDISNQFNIDMNSLYLIFETHFSQMKENIKKEYNSTN